MSCCNHQPPVVTVPACRYSYVFRRLILSYHRNVTISGLHGVADELDMDYSRSAIRLCPTCVLTIRNLTLANARRGIGSVLGGC